jgi:hypothetical protein
MRQIDEFKPFDTQTLREMNIYEFIEMKRIINILVAEVRELRKEMK